MTELKPFYDNIQAHYDLSNEFFALFLDPAMVYSCAYFSRADMTLEEAQLAKIDLALDKCDLKPGQRLLDVGCGWGATLQRAAEKYGVSAVGLTLSKEQAGHARERLSYLGDRVEVRLQGWEEFDEPVDRIVSIGAFEHFREERYTAFFERMYGMLRPGTPMLLHCITFPEDDFFRQPGVKLTVEDAQFLKFITKVIFPGGQLRAPSVICRYARAAGFEVTRLHSLQPHYATTLDLWARALASNREKAIELTSEQTFDDYMRYLTCCANYFRQGNIDLIQFSFFKPTSAGSVHSSPKEAQFG